MTYTEVKIGMSVAVGYGHVSIVEQIADSGDVQIEVSDNCQKIFPAKSGDVFLCAGRPVVLWRGARLGRVVLLIGGKNELPSEMIREARKASLTKRWDAAKQRFRLPMPKLAVGCLLIALLPGVAFGQTVATKNFVVTAPDMLLAEEVLARAESLRETLAERWLGEKLPVGVGPTVIRVKLSSSEDKGLSWVAENDSRLSHLMWLTTSRERAIGTTLAHEMTHVVLATRYPGSVPVFATEGAACEQDDPERLAMRREIVEWWAQTGNWPHVGELLESRQIEPSDTASYAHACSLTAFLLARGGRAKFIDFAVAGENRGWPNAVCDFYGYRSLASLQNAWRNFASNE